MWLWVDAGVLADRLPEFAAMVCSARVVTLLFTDLVGSAELLQRPC